MKKTYNILGLVLLLLLIIGTFFDLGIAKVVFIEGNAYSYAFEHLAPAVYGTILMISVSLMLWTVDVKQESKLKLIWFIILYLLFTAFGLFMCYSYLGLFGAIYFVVAVVVTFIYVRKIPTDSVRLYRRVGATILLTALCSMIVVESIKPIVGRVRFRAMQGDYNLFTRWYVINGDKYLPVVSSMEEIKSFPSGHSQWAGTTLTVSLLAAALPKWRHKEKTVFLIALLYAVIVMSSRMLQGAHFLSDVTVGFGFSFLFFILFRQWLLKKELPID